MRPKPAVYKWYRAIAIARPRIIVMMSGLLGSRLRPSTSSIMRSISGCSRCVASSADVNSAISSSPFDQAGQPYGEASRLNAPHRQATADGSRRPGVISSSVHERVFVHRAETHAQPADEPPPAADDEGVALLGKCSFGAVGRQTRAKTVETR